MKMNPITLFQEIEQSYRQYLETTFQFKDPLLQESFSKALSEQYLSKGPFVEAIPNFKKGETPESLFPKLLQTAIEPTFLQSINGKRNLYYHQEMAIRTIFNNRNVLVATGTGSGKTEAFLYPILLHLYLEHLNGTLNKTGVRALILYPLNALAYDQRERLGGICKSLKEYRSEFSFTFGQYIGETPENEEDNYRQASEKKYHRLPGELIFRDEMRENPPHILLTNYSMLEYLLIRPKDCDLFDNGRAHSWQFLVLDEAHQYRGTKGMEMAMLIRRLKQRLQDGGQHANFRCIATSATIASEGTDLDKVSDFASTLFGENFKTEDIVWGETISANLTIPQIEIDPIDYPILLTEIKENNGSNKLKEYYSKFNLTFDSNKNLKQQLGELLGKDRSCIKFHQLISETPLQYKQLASRIFKHAISEQTQEELLGNLIELMSLMEQPDSENNKSLTSFSSFRYHFFLRSLEGAFIQYLPHPKIHLSRVYHDGNFSFEIALCRNCGQHYLVGIKRGEKLVEPIRDPGDPNFGANFYLPIDSLTNDQVAILNNKNRIYNLCVECGMISRGNLSCEHKHSIKVIEEETADDDLRSDQMKKCHLCEYSAAGRDPVREIVHGHDGPQAVIATKLFQSLPDQRKKILAFADSRQEAAFFAWYLENSYSDILSRNLIFQAVQELCQTTSEGITLKELALQLENIYVQNNIFPATAGKFEISREIWCRLYREFLTDEHRISLEGVGLVQWYIRFPERYEIPGSLLKVPWNLKQGQALELILVLLDMMRKDRAVEINPGPRISLNWNDLNLCATQMRVRIGEPRKQPNVKSWDGKMTRRAQYLARILAQINPDISTSDALEKSIEILREIWESLENHDYGTKQAEKLLLPIKDAQRLNPDWWRIRSVDKNARIFQCQTCGQLQAINIWGVCTRHRCPGEVCAVTMEEIKNNHYRNLYQTKLPRSMRVEEHTAQLATFKAQEYQRAFQRGDIHFLSSSTTFELGVDLGDLDVVFLRNIPPETFNFAQRVGRAGRRRGFPGLSITYCHRSPHDLYHFEAPQRIIKGEIRPPILNLRNQKIILRHITATVLSHYFKQFPFRFNRVNGLLEDFQRPTFISHFEKFLESHQKEMTKILRKVIPEPMLEELGLDDGSWINGIAGNMSSLGIAIETVVEDMQKVIDFESNSQKLRKYDDAKWAQKRAQTISQEDVLSFLSRKAVIPKYGFPVDVVELEIHQLNAYHESRAVTLDRNLSLAISEFAPTSKIIANKREWESHGLKKVPAKEWPIQEYFKCEKHNLFKIWNRGETPQIEKCCSSAIKGQFLIPQFGFETYRKISKFPTRKNERLFSSRPYFVGFQNDNPEEHDFGFVKISKSSPGTMVVICEGRRGGCFWICRQCGAGFQKIKKSHKTAFGEKCSGKLERFALAHEILTDVVRLQFMFPLPKTTKEPVALAYSLAYAILEGVAFVLDVPVNDLNTTVGYSINADLLPPIIIYDNVPGGAGLVAELENKDTLIQSLREACERVSGRCGCDASCYGCLRNYRNQFIHHKLDRKFAQKYLMGILQNL